MADTRTNGDTDRVAHTLRDRLGCVVVVDGTPGATLQALDHEAVEALRDKCQRFLDGVP